MNTVLEKIERYKRDIFDLDISPFETTHTLHLRSKLEEQFSQMSFDEQLFLLSIDLQVIKNAKEISQHLESIYSSQNSHRPISHWWWHIDKIADGKLSLKNISFSEK
ncbi:hypothetical protein O0Q50_19235 [Priestia aryabhattai]|uniref:Uncharacterized protein n=1 Tax=Priestia aryabhattai TaxID=412384 RepID=A0AAX6NBP2_PRIAR|nr:hypothetical protein [Priestia aryabhattai]MDU9693308.1 hypothetical protein [Priestia aryabhattai]